MIKRDVRSASIATIVINMQGGIQVDTQNLELVILYSSPIKTERGKHTQSLDEHENPRRQQLQHQSRGSWRYGKYHRHQLLYKDDMQQRAGGIWQLYKGS